MNKYCFFIFVWLGRVTTTLIVFVLISLGYVFWQNALPDDEKPLMGDSVLRDSAEKVAARSKTCNRQQYQDAPELEYKGVYIFHPKLEYQKLCPTLKVGLNPHFGDVASFEEIYLQIKP